MNTLCFWSSELEVRIRHSEISALKGSYYDPDKNCLPILKAGIKKPTVCKALRPCKRSVNFFFLRYSIKCCFISKIQNGLYWSKVTAVSAHRSVAVRHAVRGICVGTISVKSVTASAARSSEAAFAEAARAASVYRGCEPYGLQYRAARRNGGCAAVFDVGRWEYRRR